MACIDKTVKEKALPRSHPTETPFAEIHRLGKVMANGYCVSISRLVSKEDTMRSSLPQSHLPKQQTATYSRNTQRAQEQNLSQAPSETPVETKTSYENKEKSTKKREFQPYKSALCSFSTPLLNGLGACVLHQRPVYSDPRLHTETRFEMISPIEKLDYYYQRRLFPNPQMPIITLPKGQA